MNDIRRSKLKRRQRAKDAFSRSTTKENKFVRLTSELQCPCDYVTLRQSFLSSLLRKQQYIATGSERQRARDDDKSSWWWSIQGSQSSFSSSCPKLMIMKQISFVSVDVSFGVFLLLVFSCFLCLDLLNRVSNQETKSMKR